MRIKGVGIDIADISRYVNKDDLAKRILSSSEYASYLKSLDKASFLASRFAVKESYFKASNNNIDYRKIEVRKDQGRPILYIDGKKEEAFISLSHDKEAIAIVILYEEK